MRLGVKDCFRKFLDTVLRVYVPQGTYCDQRPIMYFYARQSPETRRGPIKVFAELFYKILPDAVPIAGESDLLSSSQTRHVERQTPIEQAMVSHVSVVSETVVAGTIAILSLWPVALQ